mmetsp:Transcript_49086/g.157936  ORF Transcript_49086/g.157936 Transcript_49086/m.157936 type:complete len:124 (-) Transcript_49086:668-1039(-)
MCDLAREGPLIALLPAHAEFDDEEAAAAQFLPVVRFTFADEVTFASPLPEVPCRAVHRGFMLSAERWRTFYRRLAGMNVHLVVSPEEYERAHALLPERLPRIGFDLAACIVGGSGFTRHSLRM